MKYDQEEDPADDRNWSEEECECGQTYDMGPPWYHTRCPNCRKRAKAHADACRTKMEAIRQQVQTAMAEEVKP